MYAKNKVQNAYRYLLKSYRFDRRDKWVEGLHEALLILSKIWENM